MDFFLCCLDIFIKYAGLMSIAMAQPPIDNNFNKFYILVVFKVFWFFSCRNVYLLSPVSG